MLRSLSILGTVALIGSPALAARRHVNVNLATGANNGTSWADAYRTVDGVAVALNASVAGDEIWVAKGLYKPTATLTRTISITLKPSVRVSGGFNGTENFLEQRDLSTNVVTLSGDLAGDDGSNIFTDNSYHVINGTNASANGEFDGFIVTGGNANGATPDDRGGGILMQSPSTALIQNCIFRNNRCSFGGGAAYITSSSPKFMDCRFENNDGGSFGGAVDQATNVGTNFTRCLFTGNTAARAGAIEIFSSSPATVKVYDCIFYANTSTGSDGGGTVFSSNSSAVIANCTIYGNTSTVNAAAGILHSTGTVWISNSIVWGNMGPGGAQGSVNQLSGGTYDVKYSCVQGGFAGTGNINLDPQAINPGAGDFHLPITSPCIDAADNSLSSPGLVVDFDKRVRPFDVPSVPNTGGGPTQYADMGAFELHVPSFSLLCRGDGLAPGPSCPCGNNSPAPTGAGCTSSIGQGGLLTASGTAHYSNDTVVLSGSQMTDGPCLYYQGSTTTTNPIQFSDGLSCVTGSIIRLGVQFNVAGGSQFPNGGPSLSVAGLVSGGGAQRYYAVWYRDSAAFCTAGTNNFTNVVGISWEY